MCGVDEAGRGPLAGPVIAAAVILDPTRLDALAGIDDSKRLTKTRREKFYTIIAENAETGLGCAEVEEIDRLNILGATMLAMERAVNALSRVPDHALIDGNRAPRLKCVARTVIGGDGLSLSIAAASVIAKVTRDRLMASLAQKHPGYGWERNAGYGTREHMEALARLGPSPQHRTSFAPIAQLSLLTI